MSDNFFDISATLTTIRDYIRYGASRFRDAGVFFGHGTVSAIDEAAAIVLHTLHQPYDLSPVYLDSTLTMLEREAILAMFERRINERKPSAYLTHEAIFAGLSFFVDERVLIPRSPIAELIEDQFNPWVDPDSVNRILDLCTGSGCIAIACAYAFPDVQIDAVDLSEDALAVAAINVEKHDRVEQITLFQSDLFSQLPHERYDIIVSNPPYVAVEEWQNLPPEYHAEPAMGFKGGESGLDIVLQILASANDYLSKQGVLIVEVGSSAETLQNRFPEIPFYWLDFQRGGDGVFLLSAEQVDQFHSLFIEALN
ncbi:MAG: 50S ribosomal protein L3 N(5)-glutamine methyltransferase [Gammaproteobacteria bacterium]|uniref:50S ribosomal protein L3 N(5)-glutamine methyltransferase n=1 Tax=Methylotuvimicrobium sp. TaxID=2822413 RepID=UPI000F64E68D|nr:50S ribosomal protein L3 N(5)-glutamine methyltransferase [Gammaproteobacteria bacterium]